MSDWSNEEKTAAIEKLMERAASDPTFREMALSNPAGAMKEVAGKELPGYFNLRLVSNDGADLTLVLPDPASEELTDADLEAVSGGGRCKLTNVSGFSCG